jgi:tetratricopeptide (TPR) repeat protein
VTSLFGETLVVDESGSATRDRQLEQLQVAEAAYEAAPNSEQAAIWYGRRTAYLGRYQEAVDIYSQALQEHPDSAELLRHRGHRYITLRQFDLAIADYERAAELIRGKPDMVEPDGQPNSRNIPTGTLQTSIWYHYGLARYLKGEYALAEIAYRNCLAAAKNPDMKSAASYWLYLTLTRQLKYDAADRVANGIGTDWDIIENHAYYRLLLLYAGKLQYSDFSDETADGVQNATQAYGLCNYRLIQGNRDGAISDLKDLLASDQWAAFGYIAAEADLLRMGETPR